VGGRGERGHVLRRFQGNQRDAALRSVLSFDQPVVLIAGAVTRGRTMPRWWRRPGETAEGPYFWGRPSRSWPGPSRKNPLHPAEDMRDQWPGLRGREKRPWCSWRRLFQLRYVHRLCPPGEGVSRGSGGASWQNRVNTVDWGMTTGSSSRPAPGGIGLVAIYSASSFLAEHKYGTATFSQAAGRFLPPRPLHADRGQERLHGLLHPDDLSLLLVSLGLLVLLKVPGMAMKVAGPAGGCTWGGFRSSPPNWPNSPSRSTWPTPWPRRAPRWRFHEGLVPHS